MTKADLHVHCKYSNDPSEWLLRQLGMNESYVEIEEVYRKAKEKGMDFVTITDHNTVDGAVLLHEKYPEDTIVGVEVTTGFPETGCKIHMLLWDITKEQYDLIDTLRPNIYKLRDYIIKANVPYAVAHATYPVNGKLSMDILEKLVLMFDCFEGINGARNAYFNNAWMETLKRLTPADIDRLYLKHKIEPISKDPWNKFFTAGSDDHAALFIGQTYTQSEARTRQEFIQSLREKKTTVHGRSNNYKSMAFTFYKIAYDFYTSHPHKKQKRLWRMVNDIVFHKKRPGLKDKYILSCMSLSKKKKERIMARFIKSLGVDFLYGPYMTMDERVECVHKHVATLADEFLKLMVKKSKKDMRKGEIYKIIKDYSPIFPMVSLSAPLLGTLKNLNLNRRLVDEWKTQYLGEQPAAEKKILWFSDTLQDLNGVSVTLRQMMNVITHYDVSVKFVASIPEASAPHWPQQNFINLEPIRSFTPGFYKNYTMHFPSFLKSIEAVIAENPTEVIISTPGPVGLVGMLVAKILGIKCVGVYHTDFARQMDYILGDGMMPALVEKYSHWFYAQMDEVRVPTQQYIDNLKIRGLDKVPMKIFKRGIDVNLFQSDLSDEAVLRKQYGLEDGPTMIYAGRVSKDKGLKFLAQVYKSLQETRPDLNLIIAGKGPYLEELQDLLSEYSRVKFVGQLERKELAQAYSLSDFLVFPSTTDTFGMVVLESQACGLPALVSNVGGPQEIIRDGLTGFVLPAYHAKAWEAKILELINMAEFNTTRYLQMRQYAREHVEKNFTWQEAIADITGIKLSKPVGQESGRVPKTFGEIRRAGMRKKVS